MNSLLNKLFFVLFLLITPILNAQYLINNYEGIPIIASVPWNASDYHLDSVKAMGADFIIATNLTEPRLNEIANRGLKALPLQSNSALYNYILKYSEGAYTKWEAEGTPLGKGDAKLKYNPNIGATFNTGGRQGVVTKDSAGYDTLIYGPGYMQERRYWRIDTGYVDYTAAFNMLLTNIIPPESGNLTDTICILQVTDSKIECCYWSDQIFETSRVLLRSDFTPGVWQTFNLSYNFQSEISDEQLPSSQLFNYTYQNYQSNYPSNKNLADFVQFKIIWKGDIYSRLYVDNVIVWDNKGWQIINDVDIKNLILTQATSFPNAILDTSVAAWFGIDEPETIDNYEPMRVIDSLLKSSSQGKRGLWVSFPSSWNGKYGDSNLGAQGLYKSNEFIQRTGITPHQNNHPLYDAPYRPPEYQDYKERNIRVLADSIMNRVNDWDSTFSMTLLCGKVEEASLFHDPEPYEMLYEANLKLLYGAKSLSLYRYFGRDNDPTFTGLVNYTDSGGYDHTAKYWMVRNILAPRLKGLFGKKLKSLQQTEQTLGVYCSLNNNISFIKSILLYEDSPPPSGPIFEIGFFNDPQAYDKKYCMLLKRYYPDSTHNTFTVGFRDLSDYINWKFIDYRDTTTYTLISNLDAEATSDTIHIDRGDAAFISLHPVVLYGGSLIVDESVGNGMVLNDTLTIENGATLTVYDTYNAKANIKVKAGGKIVNGENGKIIFDPGKHLIIEGTAQINGSASDRLSLEFNSTTTEGIEVKNGGALHIFYCDVKDAQTGVKAAPGSGQINISNVNFTNCSQNGITLLGYQGDGTLTPPPPAIYNCNITGSSTDSSTGITVANYDEVLVYGNHLFNCGISILSVTSAFIQANIIDGGSVSPFAGIFIDNSGGYIRCNFATNCLNGVRLANSSVDVGSNHLYHNKYHGLYIGSGSIPNMIGRIISGQPHTWYGASGYNHITENGMGDVFGGPPDNDGSEIYFSSASALLGTVKRPGCNEIIDDRESIPSMSTLLLMNGTLADDVRELYAQNNYWGTTEPTPDRFARLPVIFSPYYSGSCPLPDGGEDKLVLKTSTGIAVDTLYPSAFVPQDITAIEASYSEADKHFIALEMEQAKAIYEQIVQGNYTSEEKLPAYNKLYTIANLTSADENYFSSLQTTFNNIANTEPDTLLMKIYKQKAINCDVSKEEYLTAISKFDNIIQQNPNSEEAVYAEIDILTTALNLDTTNSGLGKIAGGKYLVKSSSDYLTKLNNLLQNKFGINTKDKDQIIPKEYSLYQNYPNPFNPNTIIKFDLPKDGLVSLEIFDILGRRITTLVNLNRTAGSYEQTFNASSLASGVYVYKLQSGDFISSKKMILLK
jgi:tetratricopeptide (TPR) repeat protein